VDSVSFIRWNLLSWAQSIELGLNSGHQHEHKIQYTSARVKTNVKNIKQTWGLDQHAYEEGHKICLNKVKVLQIEPNTTYRKYKESVRMSLVAHPITQPKMDISPIWTPVITAEVRNCNSSSVDYVRWLFLHIGIMQRVCLFSAAFYLDSTLVF
jgi:hypothetical protein